MLSVFDPLVSLNADDQMLYLSTIDKYDSYEVAEGIEQTQFDGVAARKIRVSVNRQAFIQVDKELGEGMSADAGFQISDPKYTDAVFGGSDTFSADVYLDPNSATIIGVSLVLTFDTPIVESTFDTTMSRINTSLSVDYTTKKTIEPPASFFTEQQMDSLMKGSASF